MAALVSVLLSLALAQAPNSHASLHVSDAAPLVDPERPVTQIGKTSFSLQYWTETPCESKIEVRAGSWPRNTFGHKPDGEVRLVEAGKEKVGWHRVTVPNLKPGTRYYYRVWDPGEKPTAIETTWGAEHGWRREFAVSTEAPKGRKTIIHLPVKVLLMPNVINAESAYDLPDEPALLPAKLTDADITHIKQEYADSARVLWVASGMRLWVDYRIVIDDRWQRWGPDVDPKESKQSTKEANAFYVGLPVCRSYAGKDFADPGGGTWTFVDVHNPLAVHTEPFVEETPIAGQIEQAFVRKWNGRTKHWDFYNSGGGTYGIDEWAKGVPTRSQFLGGGDTAWLATHEFHHGLESDGAFSFGENEIDRIVFDHPAPRKRVTRGDGTVDEMVWSTNGRHGEHWDVMSYWDRQLTDVQWLRFMFGSTETVKDADEDGFPDDDPRLPLDEKRFGSSPTKVSTDGEVTDLAKAMLSNWAPGPLQSTWTKPPFQGLVPDPKKPGPLLPNPPVIVSLHPTIDGNPLEWGSAPLAGSLNRGGLSLTYKQAHDDDGYYGLFVVKGPWNRIDATFDGEAKGVYSGEGVLGFQVYNRAPEGGEAQPSGSIVEVKPLFGGAPDLKLAAKLLDTGETAIEFRLPNRGNGPWFWKGGGHEIGTAVNLWDASGRGYCLWEPYKPFYARMLEVYGEAPLPSFGPAALEPTSDVTQLHPGDAALKADAGWTISAGTGVPGTTEAALTVSGLTAREFDFVAEVDTDGPVALGAFPRTTKTPSAQQGYIGWLGAGVAKIRQPNEEESARPYQLPKGTHRVQFSRRIGEIWLVVDGLVVGHAVDSSSRMVLDRLSILAGYGGKPTVRRVWYKVGR